MLHDEDSRTLRSSNETTHGHHQGCSPPQFLSNENMKHQSAQGTTRNQMSRDVVSCTNKITHDTTHAHHRVCLPLRFSYSQNMKHQCTQATMRNQMSRDEDSRTNKSTLHTTHGHRLISFPLRLAYSQNMQTCIRMVSRPIHPFSCGMQKPNNTKMSHRNTKYLPQQT